MANKSRKVILIFVEGESDETVVGFVTDSLVKQLNQLHITLKVINGDVFSDRRYSLSSGPKIARDRITEELDKKNLKAKDLLFVAFVTDTDGIYIDPMSLVIDSSIEPKDSFQYDIKTQRLLFPTQEKKVEIVKTRQRKSRKLTQLLKEGESLTINRIQVSCYVYYNSVNLEHVLFEKLLLDHEKQDAADDFVDQYDEKGDEGLDEVLEFFKSRCPADDYEESWEFIKQHEMMQGYSNLAILFDRIQSYKDKKLESNV